MNTAQALEHEEDQYSVEPQIEKERYFRMSRERELINEAIG